MNFLDRWAKDREVQNRTAQNGRKDQGEENAREKKGGKEEEEEGGGEGGEGGESRGRGIRIGGRGKRFVDAVLITIRRTDSSSGVIDDNLRFVDSSSKTRSTRKIRRNTEDVGD